MVSDKIPSVPTLFLEFWRIYSVEVFQKHAIRTLFFEIWCVHSVKVSDNIPSVPYFLRFNEILEHKILMTYHTYIVFSVLMKFQGASFWQHTIRTLILRFNEIIGERGGGVVPDDVLSVPCFLHFHEMLVSEGFW